jgi:hypothetical protein
MANVRKLNKEIRNGMRNSLLLFLMRRISFFKHRCASALYYPKNLPKSSDIRRLLAKLF